MAETSVSDDSKPTQNESESDIDILNKRNNSQNEDSKLKTNIILPVLNTKIIIKLNFKSTNC